MAPLPASLMSVKAPIGFANAWPRYTCPQEDDASGLRFLYPECDELLNCEAVGGGTNQEALVNGTGECARFVPTHKGYSIDTHYRPYDQSENASRPDNVWSALPLGRAIPAEPPCVLDFKTSWGKYGLIRALLIFFRTQLVPLFSLVLAKLICLLCLRLPFMRATRKRNEKLQRTALKRKAEVRRMAEGGREFAVKRAAKGTGQAGSTTSQEVISQIRASAITDSKTAKKLEVGSKFLLGTKAKKEASGSSSSADGSAAPSAAGASSPRSNRIVPAAAPSFSDELKALSAKAKAEGGAD